ncbi:hypothetical protein RHMOL_Rhmol03G0143400 [Rhododendron molle]|uniref:Uncharacterized protein n=1 Tax=Rhododendron molle TaxID=49168 RepID=A0ACC0PGN6_RHOML|nr:hypothetical protein RHMOL_Rhmol03G0143400 [Rhododendron molle]
MGESDFDELEGEYDDQLDGISLESLFNQTTDLPYVCTINKKEKEENQGVESEKDKVKTQANTSIWGLLMSRRSNHCANFKDESGSKIMFGK